MPGMSDTHPGSASRVAHARDGNDRATVEGDVVTAATIDQGRAPDASLPSAYFEDVYAARADPWDFETSAYEDAKYEATLAALPRARYARGLEIGCSIGVLTARLAGRCDELLGIDMVDAPLARARDRCRDRPHVHFERMTVPEEFPVGTFDLIVVSEVGYYWSVADLERAQRRISDGLAPHGHLLLVHWTPFVPDYPLTGDDVHDAFLTGAVDDVYHRGGRRAACYRLDLFERA